MLKYLSIHIRMQRLRNTERIVLEVLIDDCACEETQIVD